MIPHIHTVDGITILLASRPVHVSKGDKYFEEVIQSIQDNLPESNIQELIDSVKHKVEHACKLTPTMSYNFGVVTYQGKPLHGYAVEKLVGLIQADMDPAPLAKFLEKLQQNPSNQTIADLYLFLEHGKMPINERGNFLAYKAVQSDYTDIHSGQFDNSIGQEVSMPRSGVDDKRENTCSHGFHVCSFDYLPHFSHANGHVMVCEINPKDVVSIPADYNNTKMRVCAYTVIGEVENYYQDKVDVLGGLEIWDEEYVLRAKEIGNPEWTTIEIFDRLYDAVDAAFAELEDFSSEWYEIQVINSSGIIVWSRMAQNT